MLKPSSDASRGGDERSCKCPEPGKPETWAFFSAPKNDVDVIAHRGGADQWPGETIFAFENAEEIGVDVLELDIWGTSDPDPNPGPTLIVTHYRRLWKTTESWKLLRQPLSYVKGLDAAFRWTPDKGETFPLRARGIGVPTLEEVFKQFGHIRMVIEIKQRSPSVVRLLMDLIEKYGMRDKVLIASFWSKPLREVRSHCVHVATSTSTWETLRFYVESHLLKRNYRPPAQAIQMRSRFLRTWLLSRKFIARAKDNYKVHAWTVDDPNDMQRAIVCGVDGIITDFPGPLIAILQEPDRKSCLPRT